MKKITNLILAIAVIMTLQNTTNAIQTKAVAEQNKINQNTAKQAKIMTDEVANSSFDKNLKHFQRSISIILELVNLYILTNIGTFLALNSGLN